MKWPAPLKNRDFLTQRFWTVGEVDGKPEYLICNNSVALKVRLGGEPGCRVSIAIARMFL